MNLSLEAPADVPVRFHAPGTGSVTTGREAIRRAAGWLESGGVLAHPTSTVYGLGARPTPELDRAIARLKGRQPGRPLLRVAASLRAVRSELPTIGWPPAAEVLADRFWPGPLTLVLPDATETGIGVRVDPDETLRELLEETGTMMTSTSLNPTGAAPIRRAAAARALVERFAAEARVALLERGDLRVSLPSTIVSLTGPELVLVREGAVSWGEVCEALAAREPGRVEEV